MRQSKQQKIDELTEILPTALENFRSFSPEKQKEYLQIFAEISETPEIQNHEGNKKGFDQFQALLTSQQTSETDGKEKKTLDETAQYFRQYCKKNKIKICFVDSRVSVVRLNNKINGDFILIDANLPLGKWLRLAYELINQPFPAIKRGHSAKNNDDLIIGFEGEIVSTTNATNNATQEIRDGIIQKRKVYFTNNSDNWISYGINKGDIVEITFSNNFDENKLSAFEDTNVDPSECVLFGFGFYNFGDFSIKQGDRIRRFKLRDINYFGYVSAVIKPFNNAPVPENTESEAITPVSPTISVTCENCGATATGTREFLRAMAWKIGASETLCTLCRW